MSEIGRQAPPVNVLLASGGRRPYLTRWFQEALLESQTGGCVIVADTDPRAPAQAFADTFVVASAVGDPGYATWLRDLLTKESINLALSINDFELSSWSRLDHEDPAFAPLLSLDETTQGVVEDKFTMASELSSAGVLVPDTALASDLTSADLGKKVVVKGRYGSGSRGLCLTTLDGLAKAIERAEGEVTDRSGRRPPDAESARELIVVQSLISGQEYGLDVVSDLQGRHAAVLARKKLIMRGGETDQAITVDPGPFHHLAEGLARAIPHRGTIDVDVIVDDDGRVHLIDVNPRFGGGYPFSHSAGANVPAAYINWALGRTARPNWLLSQPAVTSAKYVDIAVTSSRHG